MGVYGTRLFGQADRVAGLFSVRTKFFHINFVPLIPLASYLVFEQTGSSQPRGVELKKLRWNSVLLAWMRTPLWIACLGALLFAVIGAVHHDWQVAGPISGVAAAAGAAWYGSYRFAQASFERAGELASLARLTPDAVALIEQRFGRTLVLD